MRPASPKRQCFYCQQPIGSPHREDCVLVSKMVKVRMTVEYEINVPSTWDKYAVEFQRNGGSRCADRILDELKWLSKKNGCLCGVVNFEYLGDAGEPFLNER